MKSMYFKNFLIMAGMLLLSFAVLTGAFAGIGKSYFVNERKESMLNNADAVAKTARALGVESSLMGWEIRMSISSVSRSTGNHIFISDPDGVVISCSDMEMVCPHIGQKVSGAVISSLSQDGTLDLFSDLGGFYERRHYIIATAITDSRSNVMGYVFVSADSSYVVDTWRTFIILFFFIACSVMVTAVVFAYFAAKRQAHDIYEIAGAANRFAHGDFSARVGPTGRIDEIGALANAFNAMADSLEKAEESRREFIGNVSHELKTPMTTIAGFADGILDGTIPRENQDKYLETISSETKRLSRLVRRMLDISRMSESEADPANMKSFNLSEVILQTLMSFEGKINDRKLGMQLLIPEEGMLVTADKDSITQVVYNLIDNAVKFADSGSDLHLSLWKQSGKAFVSIKNHGDTISAEDLKMIFSRFHKTDKSRSLDRDGVGLGLYIVKSILNSHGEDIFVSSRDGITEIVFTLRLSA